MPALKHFLFLFLSLVLCSNCSTPEEPEINRIHEIMEAQVASWNDGDVEGFMKGYWKSDQLRFTGGKGMTTGWQEALDRYKQSYPDQSAMGELEFSGLEIELTSNQSALTVGQWTLFRKSDTLSGRFTLIWKKIHSEWLIIADHSS